MNRSKDVDEWEKRKERQGKTEILGFQASATILLRRRGCRI